MRRDDLGEGPPIRERLAGLLSRLGRERQDLTEVIVTSILLDQPLSYRQRSVDEVVLSSAGLYRLRRSLQLEPIRPLLVQQGLRVPEGVVPVVVPLALLDKSPLLDFDVTSADDEPVHLLDRQSTARRLADFLLTLAETQGVVADSELAEVILGVSLFMPGMLSSVREQAPGDRVEQLRLLLVGAYQQEYGRDEIAAWRDRALAVGRRLAARMQVPHDEDSSSENVLLALVEAPRAGLAPADVDRLLDLYVSFVDDLLGAQDGEPARWLFELGRRYVALAETVVDPDRPCRLKLDEHRALPLRTRWARQPRRLPWRTTFAEVRLVMTEARSYHLRVRSEDDSVGLLDVPTITDEMGRPVGAAYFAGLSAGSDGYSLYSADPFRPTHARISLPLRVSGDVRRGLTLVALLTALALVVVALPVRLDRAALGLATLPATFAATLLLVRERTTLAARVLRDVKWGLVVSVLVLYLLALLRVTGVYYPPQGPADVPQPPAVPSPATPPPASPAPPPPAPVGPSAPPATPSPPSPSPPSSVGATH